MGRIAATHAALNKVTSPNSISTEPHNNKTKKDKFQFKFTNGVSKFLLIINNIEIHELNEHKKKKKRNYKL